MENFLLMFSCWYLIMQISIQIRVLGFHEDIRYSNWKREIPSVNKTPLEFWYNVATNALYVYCSLKTVQGQAQSSIRTMK